METKSRTSIRVMIGAIVIVIILLLSIYLFTDDDSIDEDLEIDVNDVVFTDAVWLNGELIRPLDDVIYDDGVILIINISVHNSGSGSIDIHNIMFHVYSSTDGHINYINWGSLHDPRFPEGAFHTKRGILDNDETIVGWIVFLVPGIWEDVSTISFDYSLGFAGPVYHVSNIDLTMSEHLGTIPPRFDITVVDWEDTDHLLNESAEPGNTFVKINITVGSLWPEPVEIKTDSFYIATDGGITHRLDDLTEELEEYSKYVIIIPSAESIGLELIFQIPSSYDQVEIGYNDGVIVTCPI